MKDNEAPLQYYFYSERGPKLTPGAFFFYYALAYFLTGHVDKS